MVNKPKVAGTRFESAVVTYLQAMGFPYVERRALRGKYDGGDLLGIAGWCLELKATKAISLAALEEARREAANAGCRRFAVIHKRKNHPIPDSYVTLPLWLFAELLGDEDWIEGSIARHPSNPPGSFDAEA
jgi:hypothetical protein